MAFRDFDNLNDVLKSNNIMDHVKSNKAIIMQPEISNSNSKNNKEEMSDIIKKKKDERSQLLGSVSSLGLNQENNLQEYVPNDYENSIELDCKYEEKVPKVLNTRMKVMEKIKNYSNSKKSMNKVTVGVMKEKERSASQIDLQENIDINDDECVIQNKGKKGLSLRSSVVKLKS